MTQPMTERDYLTEINQFESHYQYDSTYMRELLQYSPDGYAKFDAFMPLSSHRDLLDLETHWLTKLAAMQVEDCGACLQLTIHMAVEAKIDKQLIEQVLAGGTGLSPEHKDIYDYAKAIAENSAVDETLQTRIDARLGTGERLELGLCIAACKMFPTIKRAVGYAKSCQLMEISVPS